MTRAVYLAIQDLRHPALIAIWMKSAMLALILFIVVGVASYWAISRHLATPAGFNALLGAGWQDAIFVILTLILVMLGAWFLFRAVILLLLGLYSDDIIAHVEGQHYPFAAAQAVKPGFGASMGMGLKSLARLIGINVAMSPFYIILLVTGIGTWALFLAVNGWLFGKDLDDMVQANHTKSNAVPPLSRVPRTLLGVLATLALSVPLLNLFVPILAVAMAVHLSHGAKP